MSIKHAFHKSDDSELKSLLRSFSISSIKVLFYPSAGFRFGNLFDLPYDVFILSDILHASEKTWATAFSHYPEGVNLHFESRHARTFKLGQKLIVFFHCDNNEVFETILSFNLKIDCFIGKNDGCREGGNYECVNESYWLQKVFKCFADRAGIYLTDHSPFINIKSELFYMKIESARSRAHKIDFGKYKLNCLFIESRNNPKSLAAAFSRVFKVDGAPPIQPFYSEFLSAWEVEH